jgi:F-type H+-transporting ATPase subunit delta
MAADPIASRYAQALFESAKAEGAAAPTLEQLTVLRQLLREHADLRQLLGNPDLEPEEKVALLGRVLAGAWSPLVQAFVRMAVSLGRAEQLPEMADAFEAAVDADEGRMRAVVRSARPLEPVALKRIVAHLEQREGKAVEARAEVDPALLGGVQIVLDYRVIDGSVRRQLTELRERLAAVRVH